MKRAQGERSYELMKLSMKQEHKESDEGKHIKAKMREGKEDGG